MPLFEEIVAGVKFQLKTLGADEAIKMMSDMVTHMRNVGFSTKEVVAKVQELLPKLAQLGMSQNAIKEISKSLGEILHPAKASNSAINQFAKLQLALFGLKNVLRVPTGLIRFTEQLAKMNVELRTMAFNTNMAVGSLMSMGGALSPFGGSAKDVANSSKRYQIQMERARQGQGFGYLADNAWKYGFGFNFGESYEDRYKRLIDRMANMSASKRLAFASDEGLSQAETSAAIYYASHGGSEAYSQRQETLKQYSEGQEEAAEAGFKLKLAQEELSQSWQQFKNYVAQYLLPIVTKVVHWLTSLVNLIKGKAIAFLTAWIMALGAAGFAIGATITALWKLTRAAMMAANALSRRGIGGGGGGGSLPGSRGGTGFWKKLWDGIVKQFKRFWPLLERGIIKLFPVIDKVIKLARAFNTLGLIIGSFCAGAIVGKAAVLGFAKAMDKIGGERLSKRREQQQLAANQEAIAKGRADVKKAKDKAYENVVLHGFSARTRAALERKGLGESDIMLLENRMIQNVKAVREQAVTAGDIMLLENRMIQNVKAVREQAVAAGDYKAMQSVNNKSEDNRQTNTFNVQVTGSNDPERDGQAIADAAAKGIYEYARSRRKGIAA